MIQRAKNGDVLRVIGTHTDITQLKVNEAELIKIKNQLIDSLYYNRKLIEASIEPLFALSMKGIITDCNEAATLEMGMSYEKLIGLNFFQFFSDIEVVKKINTELSTKGFSKNNVVIVQSVLGKKIDCLCNAATYTDSNGELIGILSSLTDISDLKKTQLNLESSALALAHSNKELQQFAYIASHDLQEPLRSISNFLGLIERRYKDKLDQDGLDFIHFALDGANRLQQMINDLLLFSRVETQGAAFSPVKVSDVIKHVLDNLKDKIETNGAMISFEKLPTIMGDEPQLITCFQNLISNAIKFHQTGIPPKIHISAKLQDNSWIFSISDNGIGIDPQYKDKLFIMFKRLVGREYAGNGIGLAICKKVIDRHGGKIWVDSTLGKGSIFYFSIPIKEN